MHEKLSLYIACSEDGFIAAEADNLDFLNIVQVEGEDYGYSQFVDSIAAIIVGRKTYEKVLEMGFPYHEDKEVYVITTTHQHSSKPNLIFYTGDIATLVSKLKSAGKNVYCDGGARLANTLITLNQVDEIILSIIPVDLHQGTLLFSRGIVPKKFRLQTEKQFSSGLIQRKYVLDEAKLS